MSPRPYRLGQRQVAADETRSRILNAARAQLETEVSFSIDAVARRADVARMTVYYQFGSRRGLLEALFDDLAVRGGIPQLPSRSEEHTSELQSHSDLVCRLLLEKKKKQIRSSR